MTIAELKQRGIGLNVLEAVAIVQQLANETRHEQPPGIQSSPSGPLVPGDLELRADGSVVCRAWAATPTVHEAAILLQMLLPRGAPLPGGLQYAIARASHEVDAPPFDSLEEFSTALSRYERGDPGAVVRRLVGRARFVLADPRADQPDRRRPTAIAPDVRRRLREIDRERYERQVIKSARTDPVRQLPAPMPSWPLVPAVTALAGLLMIAAGQMTSSRQAMTSATRSERSLGTRGDIERPAASAPIAPGDQTDTRTPQSTRASSANAPRPSHMRGRNPMRARSRMRLAWVDDFGSSHR